MLFLCKSTTWKLFHVEKESAMFTQIDDDYLNKLRKFENRIPFQDYGQGHFKPFFEVFRIQDTELSYVSQISHPKPRVHDMREQDDMVKLYNDKNEIIGVVNLNFMFPVFRDKLVKYDETMIRRQYEPKPQEEIDEILCRFQMYENEFDSEFVSDKAIMMYQLKLEEPESDIAKRSLNFKELEAQAVAYQLNDYLSFVSDSFQVNVTRDGERFIIRDDSDYYKSISYRHLSKPNIQNLLIEMTQEMNFESISVPAKN